MTAQSPDSPVRPALPASVAQSCHTDALHCIFAFLSLQELLPALHSCRGWHAAGLAQPPLGLSIRLIPAFTAELVASPLRHHVAELSFSGAGEALHLDQLRLLRKLPRLTTLRVRVEGDQLDALIRSDADSPERRAQQLRDAFPPQLHSLALTLVSDLPISQALVDALPTLPVLSALQLGSAFSAVHLAPLLQLPRLSSLGLWADVSDEQIAVIKQLGGLSSLEPGHGWKCATLLQLLTPPHSLQRLQEVSIAPDEIVEQPLIAALLQLPALTSVKADRVKPGCWAGLGGLTQLRTLWLGWPYSNALSDCSVLVSSLNAMPLLTDLRIELSRGGSFALHLPALRRLELYNTNVPSLSCLQHSSLLESLRLSSCKHLDIDELAQCLHTHAPQLRCLHVDRGQNLSDEQSALVTLRLRLPSLMEFKYNEW